MVLLKLNDVAAVVCKKTYLLIPIIIFMNAFATDIY